MRAGAASAARRARPCSWQTSSSASGAGLNRIPAALGHLLSTTLAFFTPESGGSPNANQIDSLYKILLVIALVIFVAVIGAMGYALVRFRARKGVTPAQIRGNTRLEVGWTVAAAVILVALAIVTFAKLSSIQNPPNSGAEGDRLASENGLLFASSERKLPPNGKALNITVIGRQYIWQFVYPGASEPDGLGAPYSYEEMVVPTETTVSLDIVSSDVVHSWWIPELGGKFQAVPGLPQLHVVQDPQARDLPRPVRDPLRPRPRADDRDGARGAAGAVRRLAGGPQAADHRSERCGEGSAREAEQGNRRRPG